MKSITLQPFVHLPETTTPAANMEGHLRLRPTANTAEPIEVEVSDGTTWHPLYVMLKQLPSPEIPPAPTPLYYQIWADFFSTLIRQNPQPLVVEYEEEQQAYYLTATNPRLEAQVNERIDKLKTR